MDDHAILPQEWIAGGLAGAAAGATFMLAGQDWRMALAALALTAAMSVIALIDRRAFIIPDLISLPAIPLGLLASGSLVRPGVFELVPLGNWLGTIVAPLLLYLLALGFRALRGHAALGLGDVKLVAAAGAWVGGALVPLVILIAAVSALIAVGLAKFSRRDSLTVTMGTPVPFGLYLAPAIWAVWMTSVFCPALLSLA